MTSLIIVAVAALSAISHAETLSDQVCDHIVNRVKVQDASSAFVSPESPSISPLLLQFYEGREFRPIWNDDYGPLPDVEDFLEVIRTAYREGLNAQDYYLNEIEKALSDFYNSKPELGTQDAAKLADLDLMVTQAFFLYASHVLNGRIDHKNVYPEWVVSQKPVDPKAILSEAIDSGDLPKVLQDLAPYFPKYTKLRENLIRYHAILENGGWPYVPGGPTLLKGSRGKRVTLLKERLVASGDLASLEPEKQRIFDRHVEMAVRKFQKRHGLKDDGKVGRSTLKAMNVPLETRIRQIALNMDRLRWLSRDMGSDYIFVNVADFSLEVMEDEQPAISMRIIAGKDEQRSCILSAKMTYLELNPFWRVPDSIAAKEILPQVKKDSSYLAKKNMKVFKDWSDNAKEVDPMRINWSIVRANNLSYKFRQEPGPLNPLGTIKFMFPNECEIYLHDTTERHLFGMSRRDFSHGCIRVEKPIELATYLLRNKETWTQKKIVTEIRKGKRQVVMLPEPVDVYIFYGTAWVDRDGSLQFRDDIYHADEISYDFPLKRCAVAGRHQ